MTQTWASQPGDDDRRTAGREEALEIGLPGRVEEALLEPARRKGRKRRDGAAEPGRVLLRRHHRHAEEARRLGKPAHIRDHRLAAGDGRHQALLQIDEEQHRSVGRQRHRHSPREP
jgi:hypothetical protein